MLSLILGLEEMDGGLKHNYDGTKRSTIRENEDVILLGRELGAVHTSEEMLWRLGLGGYSGQRKFGYGVPLSICLV